MRHLSTSASLTQLSSNATLELDHLHNIAYLNLVLDDKRNGIVAASVMIGDLVLDISYSGQLLGIELVNVRRYAPYD